MQVIKLCHGLGEAGVSHCVMAATSIVAGEKFSDKPVCVCPSITAALIRVNDACPNDEVRERLLGHLPWLIIGTRSPDKHVLVDRAELFRDYAREAAERAEQSKRAAASSYAASAAYAAAASAASAAYATAAYDAAAYDAAASAACDAAAWEAEMKRFIDFIEEKIIPVYTTMPVEPGYRIECLHTHEVNDV